jgi:ABC-type transporter Mla subunit MlaD
MDDKQLDALLKALFDVKAEIRDLRNDVRRAAAQADKVIADIRNGSRRARA